MESGWMKIADLPSKMKKAKMQLSAEEVSGVNRKKANQNIAHQKGIEI